MIKDFSQIKKLAENKDEENWEFRCFLKCSPLPSKEIDAVVHRLFREIRAEIDCKTCANCCKEIRPRLKEQDVEKLAKWLQMPEENFRTQYLELTEDGAFFREMPCPFLRNNTCSCYEYRPQDCASYPHLHKKDFISRLYGVLDNSSICPIVYNVYERLKDEVWHR